MYFNQRKTRRAWKQYQLSNTISVSDMSSLPSRVEEKDEEFPGIVRVEKAWSISDRDTPGGMTASSPDGNEKSWWGENDKSGGDFADGALTDSAVLGTTSLGHEASTNVITNAFAKGEIWWLRSGVEAIPLESRFSGNGGVLLSNVFHRGSGWKGGEFTWFSFHRLLHWFFIFRLPWVRFGG